VSIKIMTQVWDMDLGNPIRKLIALKLADNANDAGVCWPTIPTIAKQANCCERSVKNHIYELAKQGFLRVLKSRGRNNVYQISCSAGDALVQEVRGASAGAALGVVQEIPKVVQELPPNHKEPSIEPSNNHHIKNIQKKCDLDWSAIQLTKEQKNNIRGIRVATKTKLTQLALNAIIKEFHLAAGFGIDYEESIEIWAVRGWKAYTADWALNHKGMGNANRSNGRSASTGLDLDSIDY